MNVAYRLDTPNRQGWICRAFAKRSDWSNVPVMADVDIETIRESLRRVMARKGIKPTTLSQKASEGKNKSLVKDLFERTNDVSVSTLIKLAGALDVPLSELLSAPRVPIVGYIGAGGVIIFEEYDTGESVMRPPSISTKLEALVVRGDSMLPRFKDGDIIYISKDHEGLLPEYIGEDCAVRLVTGETYIKQVLHGSEEGRFTLISLNAPPIENVEIEWATPIAFMLPARSRHLY